MEANLITQQLQMLGKELAGEMLEHGILKDIPANTEILKEGQYIKVIPIVLSGAIKVFARFEEKDLLLYYIHPNESCIMSFSAALKNDPSRIIAVTEEDSTVLLLPVHKVEGWIKEYPGFNRLFYQQYNQQYIELLDTISLLLFGNMDRRLYTYLLEKRKLKGENILNIRHWQIAAELGTAREVITRVMKRLEQEGKVKQMPEGIKIIDTGDHDHHV